MRTTTMLIGLFFLCHSTIAQHVINTQSDIDAFCTLSPIPTNILLQPSCPSPVDLSPLNTCIADVTSITFSGNCITDISSLTNITSLNQLVIQNTKLSSLTGLENLSEIASSPNKITIKDNTCLTDISAFNTLFGGDCNSGGGESLGELVIINNDLLDDSDMDVFDCKLCAIGTALRVEDMAGISCLDQFKNLVNIPILIVSDNPNLLKVDFCNVTNLSHPTIGSSISNNPKLENLNSFKNLCSITSGFEIHNNIGIIPYGCAELCESLDGMGCDEELVSFLNNGSDCNGNCAAILPVALVNFSLTNQDEGIEISWSTLFERNNESFHILHSLNGKAFDVVGEVAGRGTVDQIQNYQFVHNNPQQGTNFYRLKQIDFDGDFVLGEVKSVQFRNEFANTLYPNPVSSELVISFHEEIKEEVEVKIYDVNGIKLKTYLIGIDTQQETLDLTDLYRGTYILSFTGSKGRIYKKILKI